MSIKGKMNLNEKICYTRKEEILISIAMILIFIAGYLIGKGF